MLTFDPSQGWFLLKNPPYKVREEIQYNALDFVRDGSIYKTRNPYAAFHYYAYADLDAQAKLIDLRMPYDLSWDVNGNPEGMIRPDGLDYTPFQAAGISYCRDTDTLVEAAAPLARTEIFDDPVVQDLAEKYDRSPAQVVVKWGIERGVVPLPKSSTPEHVRQNADLDWDLADDDLRALDERDRNHPVYDTPARDWTGDTYGIQE